MPKTITDRDMYDQVYETLGDENPNFSITGIVNAIQARYGTVHVDKVPSDVFWEIVQRHYIDAE